MKLLIHNTFNILLVFLVGMLTMAATNSPEASFSVMGGVTILGFAKPYLPAQLHVGMTPNWNTDQIAALLSGIGEPDDKTVMAVQKEAQRMGINPNQIGTKQVAALARAMSNGNKNKLLMSTGNRSVMFLLSQIESMPADLVRDIQSGQATFRPLDYYSRKQILSGGSNSTITELIKSSDDETVGQRNINNAKLDQGRVMAVEAIKLCYGQGGASDTDVAGVVYSNALDAENGDGISSSVPAGIINGEVEVKLQGNIIVDLPVKAFFRDTFSVGAAVDGRDDAFVLPMPKLWRGGESISVNLNQAGSLSESASHFVEFRLIGTGVVQR